MNVGYEDLVSFFKKLGIKVGDSVLVHSSLSSFGHVEGGAGTVIDALLKAVGKEGTVLVPTLTGKPEDGPETPPVFDVRSTPCWTGRIPTEFMKKPDAKRSLHPTHSVSGIGPSTDFLIKNHEDSMTPCGKGSPYYRLAESGGYILLVGVAHESDTTLHTVEELAEVPYHMQKEPSDATITDRDGNTFKRRLYLHDWGTPRNFEKIDGDLEELGIEKKARVGDSTVRIVDSMRMIEWVLKKLREDIRYLCKNP